MTAVTNTVVISDSRPFVLVTPIDRNPDLYVVKNDCIGPQSLEQQRAWKQIRHLLPTNAQSGCEPPYREFAQPGERITYTIAYGNNGIVTATNVILTETLPNNTTYVGGGWVPAGGRSYTIFTWHTRPAAEAARSSLSSRSTIRSHAAAIAWSTGWTLAAGNRNVI